MNLIPEEQLRSYALTKCNTIMANLVNAEIYCSPQVSSLEWDPVLRRHVFLHSIVVWRNFDAIDILVSPSGQILAFHDQKRFEGANFKRLSSDEILSIVSTTGLIGDSARVDQTDRSSDEMLIARVSQKEAGLPFCIIFTINPTSRQVAALEVLQR